MENGQNTVTERDNRSEKKSFFREVFKGVATKKNLVTLSLFVVRLITSVFSKNKDD